MLEQLGRCTRIVTTVISKPSLSVRTIVNVAAAPVVHVRPAGSILSIGVDSVPQFGEWLRISTLGAVDTAKAGTDYRVGRLHTLGAPSSDVSRNDYPLLRNVAECPNGEVYAIEDAQDSRGTRLWHIAPSTAIVTVIGTVSLAPGLVAGLTCDPTNTLYVAMNFGASGEVYRLTSTGISTKVQATGQVIGAYRGIASSSTGIIYATVIDQLSVLNPPFPQYLITLNVSTGVPVSSVRSPTGGFVGGPALAFRGARLFGVTSMSIYEINPQSGATSMIRSIQIP